MRFPGWRSAHRLLTDPALFVRHSQAANLTAKRRSDLPTATSLTQPPPCVGCSPVCKSAGLAYFGSNPTPATPARTPFSLGCLGSTLWDPASGYVRPSPGASDPRSQCVPTGPQDTIGRTGARRRVVAPVEKWPAWKDSPSRSRLLNWAGPIGRGRPWRARQVPRVVAQYWPVRAARFNSRAFEFWC